jgi:hypothetical protein
LLQVPGAPCQPNAGYGQASNWPSPVAGPSHNHHQHQQQQQQTNVSSFPAGGDHRQYRYERTAEYVERCQQQMLCASGSPWPTSADASVRAQVLDAQQRQQQQQHQNQTYAPQHLHDQYLHGGGDSEAHAQQLVSGVVSNAHQQQQQQQQPRLEAQVAATSGASNNNMVVNDLRSSLTSLAEENKWWQVAH